MKLNHYSDCLYKQNTCDYTPHMHTYVDISIIDDNISICYILKYIELVNLYLASEYT